MNIKNEFTIDINGLTIAGVKYGNPNKPIILGLHGWLDNAASFELIAEHLPEFCILAIDLIGHGKSSHRSNSQPYYIWDNVIDIHLVLDELGLDNVDIIGHSMGAAVAMLYAACFSDRVGRLFLVEGFAPLSYSENELPNLMSKAIESRIKSQYGKFKRTRGIDSLIKARMQSRFPVSEKAAKLLVARGSIKLSNGYVWSSDPALTQPSIFRMSEDQLISFLKSLVCKVYLFFGDAGIKSAEWDSFISHIQHQSCFMLVGNHHLHMQEIGASQIAGIIEGSYS